MDLYYGREGQDACSWRRPFICALNSQARHMKLWERSLRSKFAPPLTRALHWQGKSNETMAQYLVRREAQFTRLKEASPETQLSDNLKCILLAGLDAKEQQNILASANSEYGFKKVSHALRIQFPNAIQRPVIRKDYLRETQFLRRWQPDWNVRTNEISRRAAGGILCLRGRWCLRNSGGWRECHCKEDDHQEGQEDPSHKHQGLDWSASHQWQGTMEFYDCPFGKIFMPSDSNGLIFFRGVQTTTPTLDCCR